MVGRFPPERGNISIKKAILSASVYSPFKEKTKYNFIVQFQQQKFLNVTLIR